MPRSGGVMTPTAMIPVQSGSVADSSDFNDFADDVCDEITNSIPRDGSAAPTADVAWDNHRLTNLGDATAATDALNRQAADARYLPGGSLATDRLVGRDTAGTGAPEALTVGGGIGFTGSGGIALSTNGVANTNLTQMAAGEVKGRAIGAGTGNPQDLTAAQLVAIIATADGAGSGLDADLLDGNSAAAFAAASHAHAAGDTTSGTFADARVAQSNVTQHQAALGAEASTVSTLVRRNSDGDATVRLVRSEFANDDSSAVAAVAYRVNNSSDNYLRCCTMTRFKRQLVLNCTIQSDPGGTPSGTAGDVFFYY